MPPRKQAQTPPTDGDHPNPSDDDVLISTTYVPQGAYVVIAMDEAVDNQVILFAPNGAETIGDRRVKVIARDMSAADALRLIAERVDADMTNVPKGKVSPTITKKAPVAKAQRGGAGPVRTDDPDAPWGRLADGTPKQKPGRRAADTDNGAADAATPVKKAPVKKVSAVKKVPAAANGDGAPKKAATASKTVKKVPAVKKG